MVMVLGGFFSDFHPSCFFHSLIHYKTSRIPLPFLLIQIASEYIAHAHAVMATRMPTRVESDAFDLVEVEMISAWSDVVDDDDEVSNAAAS